MSTIVNPNKIGPITQRADSTIILLIPEVEHWDGNDDQLVALSKKLKNYTAYALDGQLLKEHPQSRNQYIEVQVDYYTGNLPQMIIDLFKKANDLYATSLLKFTSKDISNK